MVYLIKKQEGYMKKFDIAVIGGGSGLMVIDAALNKKMKCAIIEKAKFGGTCLTRGCIPSKMLVYPADLIRETQKSSRIGLDFSPPAINWDTVANRMWRQISYSSKIKEGLNQSEGLTVYTGIGEFTSSKTMRVSSEAGNEIEEFEADRFIIAAGARSFVPNIEGLNDVGYVTSETFFGDKFPANPWKSLIIIGGGAIGAEFAHIFSSFGTKVTMIERRPHILSGEEEEISQFVEKQFRHNNIDLFTNYKINFVEKANGNKLLLIEENSTGNTTSVQAEEIFVSSGIIPNSDLLKLEKAGVETDARGWISTNEYLETSQKNIWAIGDINGKYQFRHKANYEATILIRNLFETDEKKVVKYESVPWAIFTWPQVAHVGLTESQAKSRGLKIWIGKNYYSDVAGGIAMGYSKRSEDDGFVKIIVGENKKIIGVHIVGPYSAMLLQPFVYLMNTEYQCKCINEKTSKKNEHSSKLSSVLCPQSGSYLPIDDSMIIHPSLNELTAWVIDNIDWRKEA